MYSEKLAISPYPQFFKKNVHVRKLCRETGQCVKESPRGVNKTLKKIIECGFRVMRGIVQIVEAAIRHS